MTPTRIDFPAVRMDHKDGFPARGKLRRPLRGVLHWTSYPTWDWRPGPGEPMGRALKGTLPAQIQKVRAVGGYQGMEHRGIPYATARLDAAQWHAGGSPGLPGANFVSIGFAISYPGPSKHPRGIPGELEGPWYNRTAQRWERAWYPPIGAAALAAAASFFVWAQGQLGVFEDIVLHHQVNPEKNDCRNMESTFEAFNSEWDFDTFRRRALR